MSKEITKTKEDKENKPEFEKVKLSEDEILEKKFHLAQCKLQKDKSDIELAELELQLDKKIPMRYLQDDIDSYDKQIKEKKTTDGKDLTEADIDYMGIHLDSLKKTKKLEIPARDLRLKIDTLRYQKSRIDAPEQQIKKLEREIREGKTTVLKPQRRFPTGV